MSENLSVFQYWNEVNPPKEVHELIKLWQSDEKTDHSLYNFESAWSFIKDHFSFSTLKAFEKCLVPAMQADFFRYCILYVFGGIYLDADTEKRGCLKSLIKDSQRQGILMERHGNIANDFLYFKKAGSWLLEEAINVAENNVKNEISNNVWEVTGPGIITAFYNSPKKDTISREFEIRSVKEIREVVWFRWDLSYKSSSEDWRTFKDDSTKSIFKKT